MKPWTTAILAISIVAALLATACARPAPTPAPSPAPAPAPAPAPKPAPTPAPAPAPAPKPAPKPEPIVLKVVTAFPPAGLSNLAAWTLRDKIKARSNGELVINILGGPEVMAATDLGMAVKKGVIDMAQVFAPGYGGLVPLTGALNISRLTGAEERASGFYDFFAELHAKAGLFYLGRAANSDGDNPFFYVWLKKKIARPQEIAGVKIGAVSAASNSFLRALGAAPVSTPFPEAYVALDTGVIDGIWFTIPDLTSIKMQELPLYMIDHPYYQSNVTFIANPDTWARLPQHLKNMMIQAVKEGETEVPALYREETNKHRKIMLDAGVQLIKFSPEDAKWYVDTAYNAEWENQFKLFPELAPKAKEMLTKK